MDERRTGRDGVRIWIMTAQQSLREHLERLLALWGQAMCVSCILCPPGSRPEEGQGGILFLDGDSSERPEHLEDRGALGVILVSRDRNSVLKMYEHHSAGFLASPVEGEALGRVMDQCFRYWQQGLQWLEVPYRRDWVRLPLCQLRCAEADGRETVLHCTSGRLRCSVPLGKLAVQLPMPPFFQCQRSVVIHMGAVERLSEGDVILAGERMLISAGRRQLSQLQQQLEHWKEIRR